MDNNVTAKKVEEKEPDNIITMKVVEETKEKLIKPTENVESDFEIISKENPEAKTENMESKKNEVGDIKVVEKKQENDDKTFGTEERKKSIVDISVIKEAGDSDTIKKGNDLQECVSSMPGMTKSVSQEILKRSDVTELKQIAQDLAEEDGLENKEEEEEEGSVLDISVVEENIEKEEDIGTVDSLEAEILADDEEHVVRVSLKSYIRPSIALRP